MTGEPGVSEENVNKIKIKQKSNAWANRLRGPRKLLPEPFNTLSNVGTPALV